MSAVQSAAQNFDAEPAFLPTGRVLRWFRIVLLSAVVAGLAAAIAWLSPLYYAGETRLLVAAPATEAAGEGAQVPAGDEASISAQIEILHSAENLAQVAARLGLARSPEFNETIGLSFVSQVLIVTGLKSDPAAIPVEDRMVDVLRRNLDIHGAENDRVIVIEFSSQDPQLAAAVPNAVADVYVERQGGEAALPVAASPDLSGLAEELEQAEARLAEFHASSGLPAEADAGAAARLSDLTADLEALRAERRQSEALAQDLRAVIDAGASIEALGGDLPTGPLRELGEQQAQLKADIVELSTTLLDNHPRMRGARAQLADIEARMRAEARDALAVAESEVAAAQAREDELSARMERLETSTTQTQGQADELHALEREAEIARELLAASGGDIRAADARIFARAIVPSEPYFPKILPIAGVAFAVSLLVLALIEILRGAVSGRVMRRTVDAAPQPAASVSAPVESSAPIMVEPIVVDNLAEPSAADADDAAHGAPYESPDDGFGSGLGEIDIESAAERLIAGGATRAIFVSPEGDEAAATAVLVAREIADAGLRVLLIDLTASGAASLPMLDSASLPGITDLMASEAQFTDVIHTDNYSDCHVMPVGAADPARAMRAADRLPIIMESLAPAYDIVIVECGPANADSLGRLVSHGTEILVSVIEPDEVVAAAADALQAGGYDRLTLVTPAGHRFPDAPGPECTTA